ncbi:hypothetical protein RHGRI_005119 [Rhododendron griersonianum]|uniref:inositol-1,3,4-trisphosphate 5/6-kinase n=1 Tax=Rhododendron griersonianum TaxID=479676 RepID=A0AAV6LBG2_9ERIC|nr:hypothetical protein RHGRI_005119 [Rhododendron griersonianum]
MEVINDVFCTDEVPLIEPEAETLPPLPLPSPTDSSPPSASKTSPDDIERLHNWISMLDVGLSKLKPPIVLQEFVNHGGVIFKVYVVGNYVKCVKRNSLLRERRRRGFGS